MHAKTNPMHSPEFARMQSVQPVVADRVCAALTKPADDAARAVGLELALTVWCAFDDIAHDCLRRVDDDEWRAAEQLLFVDEDMRKTDPKTLIESDDVVAAEQPDLAAHVRKRLDETMRACDGNIDVDDIDTIYRLLVVQILALSYAVIAPPTFPSTPSC